MAAVHESSAIERILFLCVLTLAAIGVVTLFGDSLRALFAAGTGAAAALP